MVMNSGGGVVGGMNRYESWRGVDDEVVMLGLGLVDFVEVVLHSDVEFGFVIKPVGIWNCHLDLELRFIVVFGFVVLVWMWIGYLCLCFGLSEPKARWLVWNG